MTGTDQSMARLAFRMKLHPDQVDEYVRRHDDIWPDLVEQLHEHGIRDYWIFLDEESHVLFATMTLTADNRIDELRAHPIMQQWWRFMSDLMETNNDSSPVERPLRRVFSMV